MGSDSSFTSLQRRSYSSGEKEGGGPMEGFWAQTGTLEGSYGVNKTTFAEYVKVRKKEGDN